MDTTTADRAAGVVLGLACGDALGAGYEFGSAMPADAPVGMVGGGTFGWAPGEWTDDTSMAVPILQAAARAAAEGRSLSDHLDGIAAAWVEWALTAPDVGIQTRQVLSRARESGEVDAAGLARAAELVHRHNGRSGGNGSLMRTAPVALAHLGDRQAMAASARKVSAMTHFDPDAGDACVLWCASIAEAVASGAADIRVGLALLDDRPRDRWEALIDEAESKHSGAFVNNGWVVHAFQAAWSAIHHHEVGDVVGTLEDVVRDGGDTDTVAAIAGSLLGAAYGASALPQEWRDIVHGWPGMTGQNLAELALTSSAGGGSPSPALAEQDEDQGTSSQRSELDER